MRRLQPGKARIALAATAVLIALAAIAIALTQVWLRGERSEEVSWIAFLRETPDGAEIFKVKSDGSEELQVTNDRLMKTSLAVSPDGKSFAFAARQFQQDDVWLLDLDAGRLTRLTDDEADSTLPIWSPDGQRIAFSSNRTGHFEVYVMDQDGAQVRRVTTTQDDSYATSWAPDGKIVFRTGPWTRQQLFSINPDGSGMRQVTRGDAHFRYGSWSPHGSKIVASTERDGNMDIYLLDSNWREVSRLTSHREDDIFPSWSPDGRRIVFASLHDSQPLDYQIYVMNADGSDQRRLTSGGRNTYPVWLP